MSESQSELSDHLTAAIAQWEDEGRVLDAEISALVVRKDALNKRVEAARLLLSGTEAHPVTSTPVTKPKAAKKPAAPKPPRNTLGRQWQDQIMAIVMRYDRGCTYPELRADLLASPLGPRLMESKKSYERAMSLLSGAGKIERGYGRVFTPTAFSAFRKELEESGAPLPIQSQPMARSPMGEAILKIVYDAPGAKSRQIIDKLRENAEFNATLTPNEGVAYNIIARLTRRQQIVKRDDGGCFPGVAFPHQLLGLPLKTSAPDTSGGVVSLFDARRSADA